MKCHSCKNERLETTRYCLRCWIKDAVRKTLGITDKDVKEYYTDMLLDKWTGKCFYLGIDLVPGVNASLEHIQPKSVHPELNFDIDNLEWVDLAINKAKSDFPLETFKQLVSLWNSRLNGE